MAELLENLNERLPHLQSALDVQHLNNLPLKLLARGLKAHGDQLDTEHLYDWLSVRSERMRNSLNDQAIQEIRSWLERRPKIHKAIFMEGLSRCPESDEFRRHAIKVQNRLYGASSPARLRSLVPEAGRCLGGHQTANCRIPARAGFQREACHAKSYKNTRRDNETLKVYLGSTA